MRWPASATRRFDRADVTSAPVAGVPTESAADLLDRELVGGRPQVVVRPHAVPVRAGGRDEQHVTFGALGQRALVAQHVSGFADRTDDVDHGGGRLLQAGQVGDAVPGAVQRGADQAVHAGIHADEPHVSLLFELGHAAQERRSGRGVLWSRLD